MSDENYINQGIAKIAINDLTERLLKQEIDPRIVGGELLVRAMVLLKGITEDEARKEIMAGIASGTAQFGKPGRA